MPEIIKAGKLFKCLPPLYRITEKDAKKFNRGQEFVFDKKDYYGLFHKVVADNLDFSIVEPVKENDLVTGKGNVLPLDRKQKIAMLGETIEYLPELETLVKRSACDIDILEYICFFYMKSRSAPNPNDAFERLMHKKFPELHYDEEFQSVMGSVDGRYITLIVDDIFMDMSKRMMRLMHEAPAFYLLVKNHNAKRDDPKADDWELMTLGQFLQMADQSYHIDIEQRYKGLGESRANLVFPSITNPKTRRLMKITMYDAIEAMRIMEELHGDGAELREVRRQMLANADITLQDIDN